jgi:signal transduction histidine kinase
VNSSFREAIASATSFSAEYRILRNTKQYRHISVTGTPLWDEDGLIRQWVGICVDVTDQKNLEEQLRHSQKLEAVGQLAGGIAHDFNNILTVILSYCELSLLDSTLKTDQKNRISAIFEAGQRASSLTKQLLIFSRRSLLDLKPLNVNGVVKRIESMLERMIGEDIAFKTITDPTIGSVRADADQLGQVLMNLAVNARDAMPVGGLLTIETKAVTLDEHYVNTHVEVERGQYVLITVSDTGIGMCPETRARVFEPFFTTKEQGKGTGLGLSVVHGIVKQFRGKIGVYSEPHLGSVFKIYLPVVASDLVFEEKNPTTTPRLRGNETVLIVDDESAIREIAEQALKAGGYMVFCASNGNEAMQIVKGLAKPIDLLVTDVVMPGMSGRELAEKLVEIQPSIKVLYLSGYTDDSVVRHGLSHSQVNFLQKPFTPRSLAQKIRSLFEK